eukprot:CAMPEP_0184858062 /NCGR_PEP_ID=MMETSP0580-20130426/3174_1 /TAXON_ID=1118495 /ORGANISM="Dactyliosolen fragilissimus" /LENGTH=312 /DNA_ID=CAMNT_0027353983 /DNA_START=380 /DNA_END=1321 /DNA_ORIENTATION=-
MATGGSSSSIGDEPKCPVTKFSNKVTKALGILDKTVMKRILRIAHHGPALLSLSYFGLISMASMMGMGPMQVGVDATSIVKPTLASVLTKSVGQTTNTQFAQYFPTFVTPASFVFLVWPVISVLQLLTVLISSLYPTNDEFLTTTDLSSLTVANLFSTLWLLISSNATPSSLPIGSFLALPMVPLFSGYPLRNKPKYVLWAYQLFSSFTSLASFLAFSVELQYGGRIPLIGKVSAEISALIFLSLYSTASLAVPKKSFVKKFVNAGALFGILYKRIAGSMSALGSLFLSISFLSTIGCWIWSLTELFSKESK